MGNIPEYRRDPIQRPPTDTRGGARAEVARAFGNVGQAAGQAFVTMVEVEDKMAELDQRNWLNKSVPVFEREVEAIRDNHERAYIDDPMGKEDFLNQRLEKVHADFLKQANGPLARKAFGDTAQIYFQNVLSKNRQWAEKQNLENVLTTSQDSLNSLVGKAYRLPIAGASVKKDANGAPIYADGLPVMAESETVDSIGQRFDTMLNDIDLEAEPTFGALTLTINPRAREKMMQDFKKQKIMMGFKRIIDEASSNPEGPRPELIETARALLKTQKYDKDLGPDGVSALEDSLKRRYSKLKERKESVEKKYRDLKFKNPWKFFDKIDVNVPDLDLEKLNPASIEERIETVDALNKRYGTNAPLLNNREMDYMTTVFPKKTFKEQKAWFENARSIPEEDYYKIATQVSEKIPAYGGIFSLLRSESQYGENTANDIFYGMKMLEKNPATGKPLVTIPVKEARDYFERYGGNLIQDPKARRGLEQSYLAIYAKKRSELGGSQLTPEQDASVMANSFNRLMGKPVNLGASRVFSFQKEDGSFADEQLTKDLWRSTSLSKIKQTHGDVPRLPDGNGQPGKAFDISAGREGVELVPVRQNQYYLRFRGQDLLNKDGKKFLFDFGKFSKTKISPEQGFFEKLFFAPEGD